MRQTIARRQVSSNQDPETALPVQDSPFHSYPRIIYFLFFVFTAYLVFPIIDIPLLGLSLSAPIFFVIATTCVLKPVRPWFHEYRRWIILALVLWLGILISALANGLASGGMNLERSGILSIIRFAYWLLVFVVTVYFASQGLVINRLSIILGWSVFLLALLRWWEVIRYGNIGAWTGTHLLSENTYGALFSIFSPYLLYFAFTQKRWKQMLAWAGNVVLWGAVAINGSRGSWLAIGIGLGLSLILLTLTHPRKFLGLLFFLVLIASLVSVTWAALPRISTAVTERFNTFESLNTEKSYMIRDLMIQKGWRLFKESPVIGVGISRFVQTSTPLDIPRVLSYASQDYFDVKSSHNSYLGFLAECGLLGAIPFALLLVMIGVGGFKSALHFTRKKQYWAMAVFLSFIQMSIHMWAISSLTNTSTWFVYGLAAASIVVYQNRK